MEGAVVAALVKDLELQVARIGVGDITEGFDRWVGDITLDAVLEKQKT